MPRDSNGNTVPLPGTIVSSGDTVLPSQHNPMVNDVYAMMEQSLSRDGQGGMRANMDMHGFRILNVGTATQPTDAVSLGQLQNGTPVGAVIDYAGANAPATWMFAYGQAVSRTTYAALFAAIGTSYGNGNGSTTFNLPDLRGRVIAGKDDMGGANAGRLSFFGASARAIGGVFGAASHVLTEAQMPSHAHAGETQNSGSHSHSYPGPATEDNHGGSRPVGKGGNGFLQTSASGIHRHFFTTDLRGGNQAHPNAQPTIIMNKIIKVSY